MSNLDNLQFFFFIYYVYYGRLKINEYNIRHADVLA